MGLIVKILTEWFSGLAWDQLFKALFGALLSLFAIGCGVEGIHSANPGTIIRVDPSTKSIYVSNNKDVDIAFEEITATKDGFAAKNVKIVDKASSVRESNVAQIAAVGEQAKAIGEAWSMGINAGANLATSLVPMLGGLSKNPVWGSGQPGAAPSGWIYVGPPATTQPAAAE